jgi:hypothetical protein
MFGGNIRPSHKGRTRDAAHGGEHSGSALEDNKPSGRGNGEPEPEARGITEGKGDGFHHHEIHEHESGFHSKHTHPDGSVDEGEHGSMEEAMDHAHKMFSGEDSGRDEEMGEPREHSEDADEGPDFSAAYRR